ncbi:tripartite tricarboxylate transporter substrate-binding protein [Lentzea sp. NBRC 105346]|uniref:tripartite tricarboxylate transporter substrate binding protein n=1 Tax=Lentzea sp. NBRC 105346 TaxID=3032205 RepID=UPI00255563E8|nr:tripartite tricarboxylate transporter substrate-binding protein [Lentzea sp. NBRC 105346]
MITAFAVSACGQFTDTSGGGGGSSTFPSRNLEIMAPAAAGGGWDLTARSMQSALKDEKIVDKSIEVSNVVGAGGATGLAQLLSKGQGDPHQWMVTGLVMIGAAERAKNNTDLTKTTPIATLTAEAEAIVVRADSKYQNIKQLVDDFKANPAAIKWGGGSAGGSDHLVVAVLAKAAGADVKKIQYVGYSGGGEAKAGILSGDVTAGVSGVSEFKANIQAGQMRLLAVTSPAGKEGAPSLKESGYDAELMNWRCVVAGPGLSEADRTAVVNTVDKMHNSAKWKEALAKQGWEDFYKKDSEAKDFIAAETKRIKDLVKELGLS